jgi:hypothetical protein
MKAGVAHLKLMRRLIIEGMGLDGLYSNTNLKTNKVH